MQSGWTFVNILTKEEVRSMETTWPGMRTMPNAKHILLVRGYRTGQASTTSWEMLLNGVLTGTILNTLKGIRPWSTLMGRRWEPGKLYVAALMQIKILWS